MSARTGPEGSGVSHRPAAGALAVLLLVASACLPASESEPPPPPPPPTNVVVLVVDCLRADHVGAYGYHRATTPKNPRSGAKTALRCAPLGATS